MVPRAASRSPELATRRKRQGHRTDRAARPAAVQRSLEQLYGLTRAEARLAEALANGRTLAEYGALAGISLNTVKTLCKRLYAKTGHHSRGAFIRDVLENPLVGVATGADRSH